MQETETAGKRNTRKEQGQTRNGSISDREEGGARTTGGGKKLLHENEQRERRVFFKNLTFL